MSGCQCEYDRSPGAVIPCDEHKCCLKCGQVIILGSAAHERGVLFAFTVGQSIKIRALERPGVVRLLRFDGKQCDYFVSWWDEGKRQSEWMPADELEGA